MFVDIVQQRSSQDISDRGPELRDTTTALLILASVFVVLRFIARAKRGLSYGPDDWMIVVSLVRAYASLTSASNSLPWTYLKHSLFALLPEDLTIPVSSYLPKSVWNF